MLDLRAKLVLCMTLSVTLNKVKCLIKKNRYLDRVFRFFVSLLPVYMRERISRSSEKAFSELEVEKKFIFVHIPKCAGNAIIESLYNQKATGHSPISKYIEEDPKHYNEFYKFALVRDPVDRFFSAYRYLMKGGMGTYDVDFANDYLKPCGSLENFVQKMKNSKRFRKIVLGWTHFIPQHEFLFFDGDCAVDDIFRQESLSSDFSTIKKKLGVEGAFLKKVNVSKNEENDVISADSLRFLEEVYGEDIVLLGYQKN